MAKLLVIMGSGETTPTMIKPHRSFFERIAPDSKAVVLDTPYGFQLNADEISARTLGYFTQSIGRQVSVVSWRRTPPPGLERERALTSLRSASWIFAGPGSPTYALAQWQGSELPQVLTQADVLIFASAAALTLGSHTIPVYEIYKAGFAPEWTPGLGLFEQLTGIPAVVVPHYDNAEGGHHDTRFCYLGEPRLAAMEQVLPEQTLIVGVDEHTALVCDLEKREATVLGNGGLTLRQRGASERYEAGTTLPFSAFALHPGLAQAGSAPAQAEAGASEQQAEPAATTAEPTSVRAAADQCEVRFAEELQRRHVDGCVAVLLELEQAIQDWTADTLASDDADHARGVLRSMVVRLGELAAAGVHEPEDLARPYVEALIGLRQSAREQRDFALADRVRDALAGAGVQVKDTPAGPEWSLG